MKNCVGISEELYNGYQIIPRSFYLKQLMVAILISGNLICLTKISNSDLVFTLSLLMISRVIYFLVIFKTKPMTLSSLKLLNKSGQLFTSSTFFVLLVWSEYKSISSIFVKDFTNGIIVLFTGTCFLLISILKRRLNHPELEIQTVDFELLSSLFSIFSGICLCFYGDISAIDHSFNIILCLILLIYTLIISAKGVYELSNAVKNIEVDIDQIFRKYKGSVILLNMDYIIQDQTVRLLGNILLAEEGLRKFIIKDFRSLGYNTTFSFQFV